MLIHKVVGNDQNWPLVYTQLKTNDIFLIIKSKRKKLFHYAKKNIKIFAIQ